MGSHINAVTSFNSTTYKLSLPDNEKAINLGLRVLSDWAYNISFNQQDFDSERDVIIEEWRLRQGVAYRINNQLDDLRYSGSLYASRSPIGSLSVIKNSPIDEAKQFYRQWYQPQRMSLVIVGSFDQQSMKQAIEKLFEQQTKGETPQDIPALRQYVKQISPLVETIFDPEQGQRIVQVMIQKNADHLLNTPMGMRDDIIDQVWLFILNQRFNLLIEHQEIQAIKSQEKGVLLDQQRLQYTFFAVPNQNHYDEAITMIFTELQRLATIPISDREFTEAKEAILTKLTQQARDEANYRNSYQADQIVTALEYQLPMMSKKQQLSLVDTQLRNLSTKQLQQSVEKRLSSSDLRVAVIGPANDKGSITKNEIITLWEQARKNQTLADFPYQKRDIQLDIKPTHQGRIIQSENIKSINSELLTLSNGIRVILHQDKTLTDNVQIKLRVPGGQSLDNKDQIGMSAWAQQIANSSSHETVNMVQLRQRQIELSPYTELLFHGFEGSAPDDQLETLFKLLYLKMTQPSFDENKLIAAKQNAQLANSHQPVERKFLDFIHQKSFNHSERLIVNPQGAWNHFTIAQLQTKYQHMYCSPQSMTLVISGNFNRSNVKKLVEKWLAGFTNNNVNNPLMQWQDNGITPVNHTMKFDYPYGTSDKTMVSMLYSSEATWQQSDQLALSLLDTIVNLRLRTVIREQHSGVYTIIFSGQLIKNPAPYYLARLNFTTDPKRADEITSLVNQTMNTIKEYGVTSNELTQAKQAWLLNNNQMQKSAQYWVNAIAQIATDEQDFEQLKAQENIVNSNSLEQVNRLAKQFIGNHKKQFRLLPAYNRDK